MIIQRYNPKLIYHRIDYTVNQKIISPYNPLYYDNTEIYGHPLTGTFVTYSEGELLKNIQTHLPYVKDMIIYSPLQAKRSYLKSNYYTDFYVELDNIEEWNYGTDIRSQLKAIEWYLRPYILREIEQTILYSYDVKIAYLYTTRLKDDYIEASFQINEDLDYCQYIKDQLNDLITDTTYPQVFTIQYKTQLLPKLLKEYSKLHKQI